MQLTQGLVDMQYVESITSIHILASNYDQSYVAP